MGAIRKEIRISPTFNTVKQPVNQFIITANGNPLIGVVEIIVVKDETDRKAFDDE